MLLTEQEIDKLSGSPDCWSGPGLGARFDSRTFARKVEAEVRDRCAKKAAPEHIPFSDEEWRVRCDVRDSILGA